MTTVQTLTEMTTCGGCVAKAGPGWLRDLLGPLGGLFPAAAFPQLTSGLHGSDDAAIYQISDEQALIATVDFFPPPVDDPYTYGAIAAANAMSDVFAMGGEVAFALNVAAFPEDLPPEVAAEILRGGAEAVSEAGGAIAGGHTIWDAEPKYGLSVIGFAHPDRIFSKASLRAGDQLYLTKPIGMGTVLSAVREGHAPAAHRDEAVRWMRQLNRAAAEAGRVAGVRAATDVTGFGLLGHLWEMASAAGVRVELAAGAVPLLPGALEAAEAGIATSGGARNRAWVAEHATMDADVSSAQMALLFDPQTSGGLLIGCQPESAAVLEAELLERGLLVALIGSAIDGEAGIHVRAAAHA